MFVGRETELNRLNALIKRVQTSKDTKPGLALLIRGRRRVGKSRLVEEFVSRTNLPYLYFAATGRTTSEELKLFAEELASSNLPNAQSFEDVEFNSWDAALQQLSLALPDDKPSIVVIDELPYLIASDNHFEGTLQRAFDRQLSRKPVLLIGIGSDLSMMESLNEYGRPFHQRATEMVIPPLSPKEVGSMLGLAAADAFDAYLVTGGLPLVQSEWQPGHSMWQYLQEALPNPTSALLVSGERSLAAEFPADSNARLVLEAIGGGERTFANIGRAAGNMRQASLNRSLQTLLTKRVIAADEPLSSQPGAQKRYRVADAYLRFWLSFVGPRIAEIERGRGDRVLADLRESWTSWRGRAIEPVVRDALDRLAPDNLRTSKGKPAYVGGYWTRTNTPEIDLVFADKPSSATEILAVGSIKWQENAPFDAGDLSRLHAHRAQLPGADESTKLIAVSRSGFDVEGITNFGPEDLLI